MGFGKLTANQSFWDTMQNLVSSAKKKDKFLGKDAQSALNKIQKSIDSKDLESLQMINHQMKSGRADSVNKTLSSELFKTGDKIFHNKMMSDKLGVTHLQKL